VTPEQRAKAARMVGEVLTCMVVYRRHGVPDRTIVSNINAVLEPQVGFSHALKLSTLVESYLQTHKAEPDLKTFAAHCRTQEAKP